MQRSLKTILNLVFFLALLGRIEPSSAGHQSSGGGGDAYACREKTTIRLEGKNISTEGHRFYLADTYNFLKHRNNKRVRYIRESLYKELWPALVNSFEERSPGMGKALARTAQMLNIVIIPLKKFSLDPTGMGAIRDFPDDNIKEIPKNCRKVQVALQNWSNATVTIIGSAYTALTEAERALLILHESLIYARQRYGDTTELRNIVMNVVTSDDFYKNLQAERKRQGTHFVRRADAPIELWNDLQN